MVSSRVVIRMKVLCGLVIATLVLHLQCGGSCLTDSSGEKAQAASMSTEPPCHSHTEVPAKGRPPAHEGNSLCNQAPLTESKVSAGGKVALQFAAILPATIESLPPYGSFFSFVPEKPAGLSSPSLRVSVLRI